MKLNKLIERDNQDTNQTLLLNLFNGISSLEDAKEYFSDYLTTIQSKGDASYYISIGDFEKGVDDAIDKDDIVSAIKTLDGLILNLKSSDAEKYIPLEDFEKPLKDFEKRMDKNKYVKV